MIAHMHGSASEEINTPIPAYLRVPTTSKPTGGYSVLLFISGLDAYRTDYTSRTTEHVKGGFAVISVEIPDTEDCPAAKNDPKV